MDSSISKEELEHLAKLARIRLAPDEEGGLARDLGNILNYFKELQALNTDGVEPMNGGTLLSDIFREDKADGPNQGAGVDAFPGTNNGALSVPSVFEEQ